MITPKSTVVEDNTGSVVLRLHSDPDCSLYEAEMSSASGEVVGYCLREERDRTGYILSNTNGKYFIKTFFFLKDFLCQVRGGWWLQSPG